MSITGGSAGVAYPGSADAARSLTPRMASAWRARSVGTDPAYGAACPTDNEATEVRRPLYPPRWPEPTRHLGHEARRSTRDSWRIQTDLDLRTGRSNYGAPAPTGQARSSLHDCAVDDAHVAVPQLGNVLRHDWPTAATRSHCFHADRE